MQLTYSRSPGPLTVAAGATSHRAREMVESDLDAVGRTYFESSPAGTVGALADAVQDVRASWRGEYGRWVPAGCLLVPGPQHEVLAAILTVQDPPWPDVSDHFFIIDLFTHPRHRGRGLGGLLVQTAVAALQDRPVGLRVESTNTTAVALYEKHGFARRSDHVGSREG